MTCNASHSIRSAMRLWGCMVEPNFDGGPLLGHEESGADAIGSSGKGTTKSGYGNGGSVDFVRIGGQSISEGMSASIVLKYADPELPKEPDSTQLDQDLRTMRSAKEGDIDLIRAIKEAMKGSIEVSSTAVPDPNPVVSRVTSMATYS